MIDFCNAGVHPLAVSAQLAQIWADAEVNTRQMKKRFVALLYHDLTEDNAELPQEAHLQDRAVSLSQFREQLRYLVDEGYQSLTLEEYFECREGRREAPDKGVLLTFDDGFASHYEIGYRLLAEHGLKGTFFVVGDRIDQEGSLSRAQLVEMERAGMAIGSHGFTHTFLAYLSPDKVAWELAESKRALEKALGKEVHYFAFPGGHYKRWMFRLMRKAGFRGGCSCLYGWNDGRTNPFLLKRIDIRQRMDIDAFAACFDNSNINFYRGVYLLKGVLRTFVGRKFYTQLRHKLYRFYMLKR